jgi:hypothetical protein
MNAVATDSIANCGTAGAAAVFGSSHHHPEHGEARCRKEALGPRSATASALLRRCRRWHHFEADLRRWRSSGEPRMPSFSKTRCQGLDVTRLRRRAQGRSSAWNDPAGPVAVSGARQTGPAGRSRIRICYQVLARRDMANALMKQPSRAGRRPLPSTQLIPGESCGGDWICPRDDACLGGTHLEPGQTLVEQQHPVQHRGRSAAGGGC